MNPISVFIDQLSATHRHLVVADLGCGEAEIARQLGDRHKVHSFDLVAANESVVACDISHVPLPDGSVDVAIFSLSLMGTNLSHFLREAARILRPGGLLKIAEVSSRFENLDVFVKLVAEIGFKAISRDAKNPMFVFLTFKRTNQEPPSNDSLPGIELKPCLYKRR